MNKQNHWLIIGAILSLIGILIFVGVMTVNHWDFKRLATAEFETRTYEITDEFSDIFISVSTADIEISPSEDGTVRVVATEEARLSHEVTVQNGVLDISIKDTRKWYDYISAFSFHSAKIVIYLPEGEYGWLKAVGSTGDLKVSEGFTFKGIDASLSTGDTEILSSTYELCEVKSSTGNIKIKDISAGELSLTVTTGKVELEKVSISGNVLINVSTGDAILTDVACKNLVSTGSTGSITLENTIASERIEIKRSTGDVKFLSVDAAEILAETDTGDVTGSFKTEKIVFAKTDTGKVDVPKSVTGGKCEIKTDTGNIIITIE